MKEKTSHRIRIFLPKRASEKLELDLAELTKQLVIKKLAEYHGGFLGGEWGYGTDYENNVFKIHTFCWCDKDDCKYCSGEEPNFIHKKSGLRIWWYKWIGRDMKYYLKGNKKRPRNNYWQIIYNDCLNSIKPFIKLVKTLG